MNVIIIINIFMTDSSVAYVPSHFRAAHTHCIATGTGGSRLYSFIHQQARNSLVKGSVI